MSRMTDQSHDEEHDDARADSGIVGRLTGAWARRLVWAAILLVSAGYLVVGNMSVVSYRYSPFLQQTFREVDQRGFVDIWTEQVRNLPSATPQWVVNGSFVIALAVVLVTAGYGAWLLLVASGDETSVLRPGYRYRRVDD